MQCNACDEVQREFFDDVEFDACSGCGREFCGSCLTQESEDGRICGNCVVECGECGAASLAAGTEGASHTRSCLECGVFRCCEYLLHCCNRCEDDPACAAECPKTQLHLTCSDLDPCRGGKLCGVHYTLTCHQCHASVDVLKDLCNQCEKRLPVMLGRELDPIFPGPLVHLALEYIAT